MRPFTIIGLFCEDIREEKSGQDTLIGVLPDNLNIPNVPAIMPKLGIYIRVQLERNANPQTLKIKLRVPGAADMPMTKLDNLISQAKTEAETHGLPFAGLVARGVISPFPIHALGSIEAIVEVDGAEYVCGVLNLVTGSEVSTSVSGVSQPST